MPGKSSQNCFPGLHITCKKDGIHAKETKADIAESHLNLLNQYVTWIIVIQDYCNSSWTVPKSFTLSRVTNYNVRDFAHDFHNMKVMNKVSHDIMRHTVSILVENSLVKTLNN